MAPHLADIPPAGLHFIARSCACPAIAGKGARGIGVARIASRHLPGQAFAAARIPWGIQHEDKASHGATTIYRRQLEDERQPRHAGRGPGHRPAAARHPQVDIALAPPFR
jgi:hypothetical protein